MHVRPPQQIIQRMQLAIRPFYRGVDADCVRPWQPMMNGCAGDERCFSGRCMTPPAVTGKENEQTGRITFETDKGDASFDIELAQDSYATTRGLMCRETMADQWGMLFFMPTTRVQSFWMKNTLIPLDIIFIDDTWTVVGVSANAQPQTLSGRSVGKPSRYVLELNAGVAARSGIKAGTQARYFAPVKTR